MTVLSDWSISDRLTWAVMHSLWIGMTAAVILYLVMKWGKGKLSIRGRYRMIVGYQVALLALFAGLIVFPVERHVIIWSESEGVGQEKVSGEPGESHSVAGQSEAPSVILNEVTPVESEISGNVPGPSIGFVDGVDYSAYSGISGWVFLIYCLGFLGFLIRDVYGISRVRRLVKKCENELVPESLKLLFESTKERLGVSERVVIKVSRSISSPVLAGYIKPVVIFPVSCLSGLNSVQLEALVRHELAHVIHCDYLVNLAQKIVEKFLFFHPGIWWANHQIAVMREFRCDEEVVKGMEGKELEYAQALEFVAGTESAYMLAASGGPLLSRIKSILGSGGDEDLNSGSMSRRKWVGWAGVFLLALIGGFILIEGSGNKAMHEKGAPVSEVKLQGIFGWKNLPFSITEEEEAAVKRCAHLSNLAGSFVNGVSKFESPEVIEELEAILEKHPKLFYAHYLASSWYRVHNQTDKAMVYHEMAMDNAPRVLICRYVDTSGNPIAGATIQNFKIECNRVKDRYLDPSLNLLYRNLVTDQEGCIYLPTYKTVMRTTMVSHPRGWDVKYPRLGWFKSRGKFGLLPEVTGTRKVLSESAMNGNPYQLMDGVYLDNGSMIKVAGIAFGFEPGVWRDVLGKKISVPAEWRSMAKGRNIGVMIEMWGDEGLIDFELKREASGEGDGGMRMSDSMPGSGIASVNSPNQSRVFVWYGQGNLEGKSMGELIRMYKGLQIWVNTGTGNFQTLGEIAKGQTLKVEGGEFFLEDAKTVRKGKKDLIGFFGIGGTSRRDGLMSIKMDIDYDPSYEISLAAIRNDGREIRPQSHSVGSGNFNTPTRRLVRYLRVDGAKVKKFEVLARPVASRMMLEVGKSAHIHLQRASQQ